MPSGKRARQQRKAAAPPPVRSKGGAGGGLSINLSRRALLIAGVVLLALIGLGVGLGIGLSGGNGGSTTSSLPSGAIPAPPLGSPGFEGVPLEKGKNLAPPGAALQPGGTLSSGIQCNAGEQLVYHIHIRLTVFVNGQQRVIPGGVGIVQPQSTQTAHGSAVVSGACFSWLHTHAADGIIHVESPVQKTFTLGDFFQVWGIPLSQTQVGPVKGKVTTLVDGKLWSGSPNSVPLTEHRLIQLDVGKPLVQPQLITSWPGGL